MNYTPKMEKAMQQSHNMGYAEYSRKFDKRLTVEKRRQQEYEQCKHLIAEIDNQIHK
ncbi:hypothetical protein [Virgibacillus alimentarius]|uniref:Uncharacterized protein n=1 Tax=Virgibacillus alimentarius TaxID=698769 RepID=A0ABS4S756_9BACI|nr:MULTISPECIES: hypothetical protein [Virgibacillus]MBP2257343.1 hypothetical protein [Virgibacillus alimentarius]HLR68632.1 hypothetical protein [Virgibacillus sp.]